MTQPTPASESAPADDPNANAGRIATDQATEYDASIFAWTTLRFDDGSSMQIPPQPSLRQLDDDCLAAYDRLIVESESYDREVIELPERTIKDDDGNEMTLPAETKEGPYRQPYRKDGVLLSPPWEVQEVQAAIGPEQYEFLRSKMIDGRRAGAGDVRRIWSEQGLRLMERQKRDSKSADSTGDLAPVAAADSE
ncbi:hypothetical protein ACX9NE_26765 [Mycobacterium sp. ML4]|nr:hypothetical protein [Mycobacteriaceae bacterium]